MYEEEISPEIKKQYQDAFEMFDKDKDGTISAKELANVMETLIGQKPSMIEINSMIKEVDLNSDGKIELEEFTTLMMKNNPDSQQEDEVINAFRVFIIIYLYYYTIMYKHNIIYIYEKLQKITL